jgi:hypothetical protein
MKQRKLGCFTTGGVITLIIVLMVVGGSYAFYGGKMFSPGVLTANSSGILLGGVSSHADLEEQCAACHPAFWAKTRMTDLCLDCHQEVQLEMEDQGSLHGAVNAKFDGIDCRDCHTDHGGPDGQVTENLSSDFPHEAVGFSLIGHQGIAWDREVVCADCHEVGYREVPNSLCENCHIQVDEVYFGAHTRLFGAACQDCHDGIDTYGADFDHNGMPFSLEGQHADLRCDRCHAGAVSLVDLQDTPTNCESCHLDDDIHEGAMGGECGVCHVPSGWNEAVFDHSVTGFQLDGGHLELDCEDCHETATYQGAEPGCFFCHAPDDPHSGVFGEVCETCHVTAGWAEVFFDHSGPFAVNCQTCHLDDSPVGHYPGQCSACHIVSGWLPASFDHAVAGATNCLSCHSGDAPANHFSGQCSTCHSTNAWKPANFSHTFPLDHGDANQQCELCHVNQNYNNYTCYGCHEHSPAEIQEEHDDVANFNNCVRCHWDGREHEDEDGDEDDDD